LLLQRPFLAEQGLRLVNENAFLRETGKHGKGETWTGIIGSIGRGNAG